VGLLDERVGVDSTTPELMISSPEQALSLPLKSHAGPSRKRPGSHGRQAKDGSACLVVGPGLGQSGAARDWLERAMATPYSLLLDADALNLLAQDKSLIASLATRHAPTLITPHPGEAARLLGITVNEVQANRFSALTTLSQQYYASVVLKGHASLVLGDDGIPWRNTTGNPGMAAPGMGDVLCGIIAALAAQGLSLDQAAVLGVWLHGAAGDRAVAAGKGPVGLTANEVAHAAREILNSSLT
jgi:hydroxyethylthiazole kinase-like uncharacterized protein yjeF